MPQQVLDRRLLGRDALGQLSQARELLAEADERVHDLDERRVARALSDGSGRPHDRAHLHLVDLGPLQAEPAAARAEHRIRLVQLGDPLAHVVRGRFLEGGQELVQRRVEQPDRHREARHRLEDPLEVGLLDRQELVERDTPGRLVARHDHLLHDREPVLGHEHVLGATEADALRSELARLRGVLGRVGVRPHAQPAELVGPVEDRAEVLVDRRRHEPDRADDHAPGAAVDRDHVADLQRVVADRDRAGARVDREPFAAGHARLPHPPRDDRRVRGHPAMGGEDSAGLDEAVDVVGGRLPAHEDHVVARLAALARPCRRRARSRRTPRRATRSAPAPRPRRGELGSIIGCRSWSSWPGSMRATASSREISPSSAISTAMRSAAVAVRLPVRVWRR